MTLAGACAFIRRLACEFDELSRDVLHNRIIKASMLRLAKVHNMDPAIAHDLRATSRRLHDVDDIRLTGAHFSRVQLHRNNAYYDFLMRVCRLAFDLMLPTPSGTGYQFQDVLRDERKMAGVFEAFVRNFYRAQQTDFRVAPLAFGWDATAIVADAAAGLPGMRTDIFLSSPARQIIIDTKYYGEALQEHFGAKSFRSENLYQLFAYLKNAEALGSRFAAAEGMLLYPATGDKLDARYHVQGHDVRIASINLDQAWPRIESDLKVLLASAPQAAAA